MERIRTLDGWRCVAILLVLLDHFIPYPSGRAPYQWMWNVGQHGVAVFFVLSGYLITTKLMVEQEKSGGISLWRFYLRRFFRLMPCAWAYLFLLAVLTSRRHIIAPCEIRSCLLFYRNYGPATFSTLTSHFWSLSLEEQFYIFWPCVIVLLGLRNARWLAIAGTVAIAVHRIPEWTTYQNGSIYPTLHTAVRADALLVGCLAAMFAEKLREWLIRIPVPVYVALFALCVYRYQRLIPLRESILIAAMLLATSFNPSAWLSRLLEWSPLRHIGLWSYSIYVWQQVFAAYRWNSTEYLGLRLALILPVALCSYYLIERPAIRFGRRLEQPKKVEESVAVA